MVEKEINVHNAKILIDGVEAYYGVDVDLVISEGVFYEDISGEIEIPNGQHFCPALFFDKNGYPKELDATIQHESVTIELRKVLVTNNSNRLIDICARDSTVEHHDEKSDREEVVEKLRALIDDLDPEREYE